MTDTPEDMRALAELHTPLGLPGSGRQRYAAAMHFHRRGRLSAPALEIYRICSPKDGEDPAALLARRGLSTGLPGPKTPGAEQLLPALLLEIDRYLSDLQGPGLAEVRSGIAGCHNVPVVPTSTRTTRLVDRYFLPAVDALSNTHPTLADAIRGAAPYLDWMTYDEYAPDEIGPDFARNHAFASLIGAEAPIAADDFDLGLFLMAPGTLYRDHCHKAPELYAPLTGPHGWRFGPDRPLVLKPAHEPVWNPPFTPHLTKVGPQPFLCIYGWTQDANEGASIVPAADWAALEVLRITG